uniref:TRAF-type domain-containing protein n=1 Tax=Zooxanthella nutricula TaxID=1333877 RepID=A0A6U6QTD0_9DINO|mmetsp:Transcript_68697/g.210676  ORF Transcript_68697/g.210676 Transcript_68697/m.210676 type:complete len:367 (+) Transcript_68697:113-1213(+)|eukprot:CAMPEP_0198503706 /NCGR_PEP_ID=MMETSP1462-20131121/10060_1 /TAXON_ID=1333877 /ORGANISM="Brandtodinium nutriculum, Strain RCC3387" /LENGTH=366 /DNA_ID=CAMNT_0044232841 /DNA_START=94 /DNA_END=1194 /DNA_ORIENTATION=-
MRAVAVFTLAAGAAASSVQEVVDGLFDDYLPQKVPWESVKACRGSCGVDEACLARCPHYECPFKRISKQCDILETSMATVKACHQTCDHHDFACHFNCPMTTPTSLKEVGGLAKAMACHAHCGGNKTCHRSSCAKPWAKRHEHCQELEAVVACHRNSSTGRAACPRLKPSTKQALLQEPPSLVKDIMNHVVDHILPLPQGQGATTEEVRACHMGCGADHGCHKRCPAGAFGRVKDQCGTLKEAHTCHTACKHLETACPVKKAECHFKCPVSMPTSVRELKGLTDHVICHMSCGSDGACHKGCPASVWARKQAQCEVYDAMVACHKACGHHSHSCHASCPRLPTDMLEEFPEQPRSLAKEIIDVLVV